MPGPAHCGIPHPCVQRLVSHQPCSNEQVTLVHYVLISEMGIQTLVGQVMDTAMVDFLCPPHSVDHTTLPIASSHLGL